MMPKNFIKPVSRKKLAKKRSTIFFISLIGIGIVLVLTIHNANLIKQPTHATIGTKAIKKPIPSPISDAEILQLLANAYSRKRDLVYAYDNPPIPGPNGTYKAKSELNTIQKMKDYLSVYWSNFAINNIFEENKDFFKEIDGELYLQIGDYGLMHDFLNSKIISTKDTHNKKEVICKVPTTLSDYEFITFTLEFTENKWVVDSCSF